jgi:hypothetical protein
VFGSWLWYLTRRISIFGRVFDSDTSGLLKTSTTNTFISLSRNVAAIFEVWVLRSRH